MLNSEYKTAMCQIGNSFGLITLVLYYDYTTCTNIYSVTILINLWAYMYAPQTLHRGPYYFYKSLSHQYNSTLST